MTRHASGAKVLVVESLLFLDRESALEALLAVMPGLPRAAERAAAATSAQLEVLQPKVAAQLYPDVLRAHLTEELQACQRAAHVEVNFGVRNSMVIIPDADGLVRCRVLMAHDKSGNPAPAQSLARRMEYAPAGLGTWKAEPLEVSFDAPPLVGAINLALTWRREGGGLALFLVRPISGIGDEAQAYWCARLPVLEPVVEPASSDYPDEDLGGYRMRGDVVDGSQDFLSDPRLDDDEPWS